MPHQILDKYEDALFAFLSTARPTLDLRTELYDIDMEIQRIGLTESPDRINRMLRTHVRAQAAFAEALEATRQVPK